MTTRRAAAAAAVALFVALTSARAVAQEPGAPPDELDAVLDPSSAPRDEPPVQPRAPDAPDGHGAPRDEPVLPLDGLSPEEPEAPSAASDRLSFRLVAGGEYHFETDVSSLGKFNVSRFRALLGMHAKLAEDLSLDVDLGFDFGQYDFSLSSPMGPTTDPWNDIQTYSLRASFNIDITPDWQLVLSPFLESSRESGASFSDSITGGGFAALVFRASDSLIIGGGLGLATRLEDADRWVPIIVVNWQITNDLRMTTRVLEQFGGRSAIELDWNLGKGWDIAVGGAYEYRRFRLSESGAVPNGIGQDESIPIYARLGWERASFKLSVFGGLAFEGELELEDASGTDLGSSEFDTQALAAIYASVRF